MKTDENLPVFALLTAGYISRVRLKLTLLSQFPTRRVSSFCSIRPSGRVVVVVLPPRRPKPSRLSDRLCRGADAMDIRLPPHD